MDRGLNTALLKRLSNWRVPRVGKQLVTKTAPADPGNMGTIMRLGLRWALLLTFGGAAYTVAMMQQSDRYVAFGLGLIAIAFLAYVIPTPGRGPLKV